MGKLTYSLNVSLDGFIETPDHSLDWAAVDEDVHQWFNEQTRTLDASLYGRRMYEVMAAYWPTAEDDPAATEVTREFAHLVPMPKIVFSTSLSIESITTPASCAATWARCWMHSGPSSKAISTSALTRRAVRPPRARGRISAQASIRSFSALTLLADARRSAMAAPD